LAQQGTAAVLARLLSKYNQLNNGQQEPTTAIFSHGERTE
jgi:hypothetical protein